MRVLLVDTTLYSPVTPLFLDALQELKREHRFIDEGLFLRPLERSLIHKIGYRVLGRRPLTRGAFNGALLREALRFGPELVLVVKGACVAPRTLAQIQRETGAVLVNYATDDPFNPAVSTPDLVSSIPRYDFYACTKKAIIPDVRRAGGRHVSFIQFGYKPAVHFPERPVSPDEIRRFQSDVVFVGNAGIDRVPYLEALGRVPGASVAVFGGSWARYASLRRWARGPAVGREYRLALGGAKIAICLVRRANRDGHTMRTFEIPACGAFMLAERTGEHLELFAEGEEAAFFGSPDELVDKVRYYLVHDDERRRIADRGRARVMGGRHTYTDRLSELLDGVATVPVSHR